MPQQKAMNFCRYSGKTCIGCVGKTVMWRVAETPAKVRADKTGQMPYNAGSPRTLAFQQGGVRSKTASHVIYGRSGAHTLAKIIAMLPLSTEIYPGEASYPTAVCRGSMNSPPGIAADPLFHQSRQVHRLSYLQSKMQRIKKLTVD